MKELLHVFYADEYIGDITYDNETKEYNYIQKSNSKWAKMWNDITNADKGPNRFKETLLDTRVMSADRLDCREILKRMGLLEYDPWKIMKQIYFTSDDFFWAHEDMIPEWFWTDHYLASYHEDYTKKTGKPMYSQVMPVDDFSIY